MTDITDLCAAALVATQHAFDEQDDVGLWLVAIRAWRLATEASHVENPTAMDKGLTEACYNAGNTAHFAKRAAANQGGDIELTSRCALTAAEVVMMWID